VTALVTALDLDDAGVVLTITGAPAGAVSIVRTDVNGTAPVRLRTGQEPIAGTLIVTDYEAALVGTLLYVWTDALGATGAVSTSLDLEGTPARIAHAQLPAMRTTPEYVTGYGASRTSATVVHWPADRGDPVVMTRPARTREGSLTAFYRSHAEAAAGAAVLTPGRFLHLRQADHAGLDMHFAVLDSTVEPLELLAAGWVWSVAAQFVEVKSPNVPLLGAAGWTYADLTAASTSYSAVRVEFDTYADLIVGPL